MKAWSAAALLVAGMAVGLAASHWLGGAGTPPVPERSTKDAAEDAADAHRDAGAAAPPGEVHLDAAARALAGIESAVPARERVVPEQLTTGRVADLGELLGTLREVAAAQTARAAQADVLAAVRARRARLRALADQGEITVARELAELELGARREEAAAQARGAEFDTLVARLRARWGASLAAAALADDGLAALRRPGAQLVEFSGGAAAPAAVAVSADDERAHARAAAVIGPAPAALGGAGRASWYAWLDAPELRVGMLLSVWLADAGDGIGGALLVPAAVVWSEGAQWFYVERAPGVFVRRQVPGTALARPDGLLLATGLADGEAVVVRGAQALLAEESRRQIPQEDDD